MDLIPLFPLNAVLFPRTFLPLFVFEERYRLMMKRVLSENIPIGICLIKKGQEVGGLAEPYEVGTSASVVASERLRDGNYKVVVRGERKFKILWIDYSEPYLQASVTWLDHDVLNKDNSLELQLKEAVVPLFKRYMTMLSENYSITPLREEVHTYPPVHYSYIVADVLQLTLDEKQLLLEATSTSERLRMEYEYLSRIIMP